MYREWINVLISSPLFRGINSEDLVSMLDCLQPKLQRYMPREIAAMCGQPFQGIGIVASGKVAVVRETYSGNRIILDIIDTGGIFGEMVAFSDGKVWPVTVIAQEASCMLFLPPEKILGNCANICSSHTALIMNMLNIISNRALMLNRKIEHLAARSIRSKVSRYLLDMYRQNGDTAFIIPMKRHELADYLGMPRPSLSREMGSMRNAGIIEFEGSSIKIKQVLRLEEPIE